MSDYRAGRQRGLSRGGLAPAVARPTGQHNGREAYLQARLQARTEWEEGFRRSRRGNLWRLYDGQTLSVFARPDGTFGWCVAGTDGPRYSPGGYPDEEMALAALWDETGRNHWC